LLAASRRVSGGAPFLPIAAIGLALHPHAQVFASCGLETALFAFLVTALLLLAAWAKRPATFALAGAVGTLAAMTRPDGLLVCAIVGVHALWRAARGALPWRHVVALALPGVLAYLPYFFWKWSYYGYPVPNTFYAKTAHDPYLTQGLLYLRLFFGCYWGLALAGVAVLLAPVLTGRGGHRADPGAPADALPQLTLAFVFGYLAFVLWVGGDFMFARFVMPMTPALYLGFELLRRAWPGALPALLLLSLAIAGTVLRRFPAEFEDRGDINGIVEETTYYPADEVAHKRRCGETLRRLFAGHESRVAIGGAQAMLAFYGKFDLAIECSTGLTDAYLAHLPLPERTRIGHEKSALRDPDYIVRRRVQFQFDTRNPNAPYPDHRHVEFGTFWGRIVTYDRALMRSLREQKAAKFVDCEAYLDGLIPKLDATPTDAVETLWRELDPYYFTPNDDPAREQPFRTRLGLPPR
jgi:hypothetical protein